MVRRRSPWRVLLGMLLLVILFTCILMGGALFSVYKSQRGHSPRPQGTADPQSSVLHLAYSPEKKELLQPLIDAFNSKKLQSDDGHCLQVIGETVAPSKMTEGIISGEWQAVSPDSSLWLGIFDREWQKAHGPAAWVVGESYRYAVTPVVLAMWENVADAFGWPKRMISWKDVQQRATQNAKFRWGHPSSTYDASGMLATLAEFYAGAGDTRSLTKQQATDKQTLEYVAQIEHSITYYGEGESVLLQQALARGPDFLDAFVTSEQMVINYNQQRPGGPHLVAVYPAEGTLWLDHPLALLEQPDLTANQRRTFQEFKRFLMSTETQEKVLTAGYRPADLTIPINKAGTPWHDTPWVDALQPQTTLQIPAPGVIEVVRNAWFYTKRQANIFLVVDSSGSMKGKKMERTKDALYSFLGQMPPGQQVGFVQFATEVVTVEPLAPLDENEPILKTDIEDMKADGKTALLDGVEVALDRLRRRHDQERINAIVVMTDGRENNSSTSPRELLREVQQGAAEGTKVIIFAVAFGDDADYDTLRALTEATGGQVREGNIETIQELYQLLSTYF